jgi:uncharacterized membrane protein YsdA (DUF1294 family)
MFWTIVIGLIFGYLGFIFVGEWFTQKYRKTKFGNWWRKYVIEDIDELN